METCTPIQRFCVMKALKPVVSIGMSELPTAVGGATMAGTSATTHGFSHNGQVGFMGQYQGFIKPHTLFDFEKSAKSKPGNPEVSGML